jgi:hypothetical protein
MALQKISGDLRYPNQHSNFGFYYTGSLAMKNTVLMDSLNDKFTQIGYVRWADGGASKTISKIHLYVNTVTSPVGTLTVGYQGVTTAVPHQGDGSFARSTTVAMNTLAAATTISPTISGTGTVSDGDIIAVVAEITAYTSGSFTFGGPDITATGANPSVFLNASAQTQLPNLLLEASDGVFGTLYEGAWITGIADGQTSTQNDEFGFAFSAPFKCKVSGLYVHMRPSNSSITLDVNLCTTPTATPSSVSGFPKTYTSKDYGIITSAMRTAFLHFGAEYELAANTVYGVAVKLNTSASTLYWSELSVPSSTHKTIYAPDYNFLSRSGGTGNYTTTGTKLVVAALRVSSLDDGAGGSSLVVSRSLPLIYT